MHYFDYTLDDFKTEEARNFFASRLHKGNINLFNEILNSAKKIGFEREFLRDHNSAISYKDLFLNAYVISNKLEKILINQQNIGLFLPNSVGHVTTLLALFKINKTPTIFNFSMGENTLIDCIHLSNTKTILTSKEFIKSGNFTDLILSLSNHAKILYLEDIKQSITTPEKLMGATYFRLKQPALEKNDAIILFTSGSENKPKGVILEHQHIYSDIVQSASQIIIKKSDRFFNALPMFHSFGLTVGTLLPLTFGIPTFLYPSPLHYKEIPEYIFRDQSTFLFGTSTFLEYYGKSAKPHQFSSLKHVVAGGEKVKEEVYNVYSDKYGIRIIEGYGCTEASPIVALNSPLKFKKGTVGNILPLIEYKLEQVEGISQGGNLFIKGPNLMRGYLLHEKGFVPTEEWYDTGDIVDIDSDGFVTILSRLKRFSKIGGEMISLNSVEALSSECFPNTAFAAISVPDRRKGERIVLYTTGSEDVVKDRTLKKHIKSKKVSTLHIPSEIIYISEIPLLGSGKTDYVTLKQQFDIDNL